MADILSDALREATLAVLLGSTTIPHQVVDFNGQMQQGTITIASAFAERIRSQAHKGDFDALIAEAMGKVDSEAVARAVETLLAEEILQGLRRTNYYGRDEPNWLQAQARSIAVEAVTAALKDDEGLLDTLRAKIGAEVDRNRVGISVHLSDPEV